MQDRLPRPPSGSRGHDDQPPTGALVGAGMEPEPAVPAMALTRSGRLIDPRSSMVIASSFALRAVRMSPLPRDAQRVAARLDPDTSVGYGMACPSVAYSVQNPAGEMISVESTATAPLAAASPALPAVTVPWSRRRPSTSDASPDRTRWHRRRLRRLSARPSPPRDAGTVPGTTTCTGDAADLRDGPTKRQGEVHLPGGTNPDGGLPQHAPPRHWLEETTGRLPALPPFGLADLRGVQVVTGAEEAASATTLFRCPM